MYNLHCLSFCMYMNFVDMPVYLMNKTWMHLKFFKGPRNSLIMVLL